MQAERKRSLTPTLTPEEEPLKKSRSSSFEETDPISQEIHSAVQKVSRVALAISHAVQHVPVAKWSSLGTYAEARIQFAKNFFAKIIQNRCPDYHFQVPDVETRVEDQQAAAPAVHGLNPSPPDRTPSENLAKLLRALGQLQTYLVDCRMKLEDQEQEKLFREAQNYDNFVFKHYLPKVSELNELTPPKYFTNEDLLVACPRRACRLIEKIEANPLFQRPDVKSRLKGYLDLAQQIHDHFEEAMASLDSCKQSMETWKNLQTIFQQQLQEAKAKRRYQDEAHVMRHLQKMDQLCRRQQERSVQEPKEEWENAKDYGQPPNYCSELKICHLSVAHSVVQGFRHKPPIEDAIAAEEMLVTIRGQNMTLPLFMVADGHGGHFASMQCQATLKAVFSSEIVKYNQHELTRHGMMNAAKATCLTLQKDAPEVSGTTLLFATVVNDVLFVFSVGDSRAWLLGDQVRTLTFDASPKEPECQDKVRLRGGKVKEDKYGMHRVAGVLNLSLSASIGDKLDAQHLVHVPKVQVVSLDSSPSPLYLLLASDGLSTVCSDGQLHSFFKELVAKGLSIEAIVSHLQHRIQAAWATKDIVKDDRVTKVSDDVALVLVRLK